MTKARIYFISETAPVNTHASSVVFYRHLQQLTAEGHQVIWVTDRNSYLANRDKVKQWECIVLPNRRWHLPPYRGRGLAQYYRFEYYYRSYLHSVINDGPAVLLTHISGQFLAPFSAYVHKRTQIPLISFFHDDILELNFNRNRRSLVKNTKKVLEASTSVLTVSAEFKNNWPLYSSKFKLLYPLPEAYDPSRYAITEKQKSTFTIAYAGAVYDEILPCFERLLYHFKDTNHRLLIIGDDKKTESLSKRFPDNLVCRGLFDKPEEAFNFLISNSEAMIIPYPAEIKLMPWIATCFPSKFLQYCQLMLPTIIIAPTMSAIGKWCSDHSWPLYSADYSPESLSRLLNERNKEAVMHKIIHLNAGDFNPQHIAGQLEEALQQAINSVTQCQ